MATAHTQLYKTTTLTLSQEEVLWLLALLRCPDGVVRPDKSGELGDIGASLYQTIREAKPA